MVKFVPLSMVAALAVLAQVVYAEPESTHYEHDEAFLGAAHALTTSNGHRIRAIVQERNTATNKPFNWKINPATLLTCACAIAVNYDCCSGTLGPTVPNPTTELYKGGIQARDLTRRAHDDAFMAAARELVAMASGSNEERVLVQIRDDKTGLYSTTACNGPIDNCKLSVDLA